MIPKVFLFLLTILIVFMYSFMGEAYNLDTWDIRYTTQHDTIDSMTAATGYIPDTSGWRMSYKNSTDGKWYSYFNGYITVQADSLADSCYIVVEYNLGNGTTAYWERDVSTATKISAESTDYDIWISDYCPYAVRLYIYSSAAGEGFTSRFQPYNKPPNFK